MIVMNVNSKWRQNVENLKKKINQVQMFDSVWENKKLLFVLLFFCELMSMAKKPQLFAYTQTKTQISFMVLNHKADQCLCFFLYLDSLFVYFINTKFPVSCCHLLWAYRVVCVGPGLKPMYLHIMRLMCYCINTANGLL